MKQIKDLSAFGQLLFIIGLMVGGLLVNLLLTLVCTLPFGGLDVLAHPAEHVGTLKCLQIIQAICLFIVPGYIYSRFTSTSNYLKLSTPIHWKTGIIITISILAAIPFINLLGDVNAKMKLPEALSSIEAWMQMAELRAKEITEILVSGSTIGALFINLIMIAVLPAIGEEIIFRGVLQPILLKSTKNIHIAVILTAFIFSAFHLQFYGFLPRFFIGIILGYLFIYSGSLWLPILAHFINNATATLFLFLYNNGRVTDNIDTLGTGDTWLMGILSGGILLILLFYLERNKIELKLNESKTTLIP